MWDQLPSLPSNIFDKPTTEGKKDEKDIIPPQKGRNREERESLRIDIAYGKIK